MRIIICGPIFDEKYELLMPNISPAAGKYLRNLMRGFENRNIEVRAVSYLPVPEAKYVFQEKALFQNIIVIPKQRNVLKSIIEYHNEIFSIVKKDDIVLFYNYRYTEWEIVEKLQKEGGDCRLILADHTTAKEESNIVRKYIAYKNERIYKKFTKVVLLSESANKLLKKNAEVKIIEGGIDYKKFDNINIPTQKENINMIYAGTFSKVTGIDILLDAMNKVQNKNIHLYFTGKGELQNDIEEASKKNQNIHFLGFLPEEDYYNTLNQMDVCINPRNMNYVQNQNNFPSKVLEYLASGRITFSTKFPGWEKWNNNFIFYDGRSESLKNLIENFCFNQDQMNKTYLENRKKAKDYDWKIQCMKMIQ